MKNISKQSKEKVIEAAKSALDSNNINYKLDNGIFSMKYNLNDILCDVSIFCSNIFYVISIAYPTVIGESNIEKAINLVNLRNLDIPLGSFEIDPEQRIISFRYGGLVTDKSFPTENRIFEDLRYSLAAVRGESSILQELT